MPFLRWPSLRRPLDVLFLLTCLGLTALVLYPEIVGHGKTKDYSLWYWAGQQVLHGGNLYDKGPDGFLEFIYPPLSAILLALPSALGKAPLYIGLCLLNSVTWWLVSLLSHAMTGSERIPGPWLVALPGFATVTFVFDMYDLGQPNFLLLLIVLAGFWLIGQGRAWSGGGMFALATAIKVFPVAVLPYLIWRRRWAASAGMMAGLVVLLLLLPAPIRGYQRNVDELRGWFHEMVGSSSEKGFGQRDEQNWSWVNQSVIAVTHRLVRPINYYQDVHEHRPAYMNVIDVDYKTANWIVLAVCAAIGLGFIALIPAQSKTTPRSNAEELGILLCLMTIASPLARQYYFIWLFFPMTVLMHRAVFDPRPRVRTAMWLVLMLSGVLMLLSLPLFPELWQALGNNLAATMVMVAGLGWQMRHPPAQSELSPEMSLVPQGKTDGTHPG